MGNPIDSDALLAAFKAEGINTETVKFQRAFRIAMNPSGCADCGAHTRIAVPVDLSNPEGEHKTSCCGRKAF